MCNMSGRRWQFLPPTWENWPESLTHDPARATGAPGDEPADGSSLTVSLFLTTLSHLPNKQIIVKNKSNCLILVMAEFKRILVSVWFCNLAFWFRYATDMKIISVTALWFLASTIFISQLACCYSCLYICGKHTNWQKYYFFCFQNSWFHLKKSLRT